MSTLGQDLRYATRTLTNSRGFTLVALLTLALGIGANTAIFSFVDGFLLKPLPYEHPDRIVRVLEKPPRGERNGISTLNFLDWQKDNAVFDFHGRPDRRQRHDDRRVSDPIQLRGARVSAPTSTSSAIKPALGRTFLPGEDQLGKDQRRVLSHALWVNQFGADPASQPDDSARRRSPTRSSASCPGSAFDRAFTRFGGRWRSSRRT